MVYASSHEPRPPRIQVFVERRRRDRSRRFAERDSIRAGHGNQPTWLLSRDPRAVLGTVTGLREDFLRKGLFRVQGNGDLRETSLGDGLGVSRTETSLPRRLAEMDSRRVAQSIESRVVPPVERIESFAIHLPANANMREGTEESKYVQKPQHHNDHNDRVQNGLNRSLHGYEAVDKPKQYSYNDQNRHNG
jgi:hypothetical protein